MKKILFFLVAWMFLAGGGAMAQDNEEDFRGKLELSGYAPGQFVLGEEQKETLKELAIKLQGIISAAKGNALLTMWIIGCTDSSGSLTKNKLVGTFRAWEVRDFFQLQFPEETFLAFSARSNARKVVIAWSIYVLPPPSVVGEALLTEEPAKPEPEKMKLAKRDYWEGPFGLPIVLFLLVVLLGCLASWVFCRSKK